MMERVSGIDVGEHKSTFEKESESDAESEEGIINNQGFLIYGLLIIIMGLALPIKEALGSSWANGDIMEGYHICLLVVSIAFLVYLQAYLLPVQQKEHDAAQKRKHHTGHFNPSINKEDGAFNGVGNSEQHEFASVSSEGSIRHERDGHATKKSPLGTNAAENAKESGQYVWTSVKGANFYLRLGAVGFGVGGMIYYGLSLTGYILQPASTCGSVLLPYVNGIHMIFIFLQTYFMFKNSQVCVTKHKAFVTWGLVHTLATNMCVWSKTIMMEAIEAIYHHREHETHESGNHTTYPGTGTHNVSHVAMEPYKDETHICYTSTPIYVVSASPYLFPCIIEYSLISASVIYRVMSHVGFLPKRVEIKMDEDDGGIQDQHEAPSYSHFKYDQCHKANKGVFTGLAVIVTTIVMAIVFFVFSRRSDDRDVAMLVLHSCTSVLLCLMSLAIVISFYKMTGMRSVIDNDDQIEGIILGVAFIGLLANDFFMVLASIDKIRKHKFLPRLVLDTVASLLSTLQGSLQTVFILTYLPKRAVTKHHTEAKPGRGLVTFLILCNVAFWGITTFLEKEANEYQREVYGEIAWNIIGHISLPLTIFYRFHSSAILAEIWHEAFTKSHEH